MNFSVSRLLEICRFVRLTPFEQDTPSGRSAERYRRAALTAMADVVAKASAMVLMFVSVAVTIPYLGSERFGIWATITSLTAMLSLLDLGMGNALINRIAGASTDTDKAVLLKTVSGGLAALAGLGAIVGALLLGFAAIAPWSAIIKLSDPANVAETRRAAMVFAVLFGSNILATGVRSIFQGLQRGYVAHVATAAAYLVAVVAVWLGARSQVDVPTLLLLTFGIQLLASVPLLALALSEQLLSWPGIGGALTEAKALIRIGWLFLMLQIGAMIAWGGDSLMIAHVRGADDVTVFNIVQRAFMFVAMPLALASAPLWGAYAEAKARNEYAFLERTLKASLRLVLIAGLVGVSLIVFVSQPLIAWWTNDAVTVPFDLTIAFALLTLTQGLGAALGVFLNGTSIIKPQIAAIMPLIIFGFPLKWYFLGNYGISSFVFCSLFAYVLTHGTVYLILYRRFLLKKKRM